jgi:hypothetical protein
MALIYLKKKLLVAISHQEIKVSETFVGGQNPKPAKK